MSVLWYVFEFNKETRVCSWNVADALEEATCLISKAEGHVCTPFYYQLINVPLRVQNVAGTNDWRPMQWSGWRSPCSINRLVKKFWGKDFVIAPAPSEMLPGPSLVLPPSEVMACFLLCSQLLVFVTLSHTYATWEKLKFSVPMLLVVCFLGP
jgi:hypothetical protein